MFSTPSLNTVATSSTCAQGWEGSVQISIVGVTFTNNTAGAAGGADNSIPFNGGAVLLLGPSDGASFVGYAMNASFASCSFTGNHAEGEGG